jgi:hypothetical protein
MGRLRRLAEGIYSDDQGTLYMHLKSFLARHGMPDTPESRRALMEQIREEFGDIKVAVIEEDPEKLP